ncbi:MAG: recombination protein NinG [Thermotogota bacterium]
MNDINISRYKNKSTSWLKEELWRLFSLWIRQKEADENGIVRCSTCGAFRHWRYLDAGHYMSRRHLSTKYNEKNVHPQCKQCNGPYSGEQALMARFIDKKYGLGTAQHLEYTSRRESHWTRFDYILKIQEYKQKLVDHGFETK